eukprot:Tbor_TRINITY_DN2875_c0_g1::TRINITY_DN2875_c0_g1_i1::g.23132::m.23132
MELYRITGTVTTAMAHYLHNLRQHPPVLYLTLTGEYEYLIQGRLGGDSGLTAAGEAYAKVLHRFIVEDIDRDYAAKELMKKNNNNSNSNNKNNNNLINYNSEDISVIIGGQLSPDPTIENTKCLRTFPTKIQLPYSQSNSPLLFNNNGTEEIKYIVMSSTARSAVETCKHFSAMNFGDNDNNDNDIHNINNKSNYNTILNTSDKYSNHRCWVSFFPTLADLNYGHLEGSYKDEIQHTVPNTYKRLLADPYSVAWPGGESVEQLYSYRLHQHLIDVQASTATAVIVVSHEPVIQGMLVFFGSSDERPENAHMKRIPLHNVIKLEMRGPWWVYKFVDLSEEVKEVMGHCKGDGDNINSKR